MTDKFEPTGYSAIIHKTRYAFTENETWDETCRRVARQVAMAEPPDKVLKYEDKFYRALVGNLITAGGRILYNSGRPNPQLLNCFVLTDDLDSKEGWAKGSSEMIVTSMTGGGCGMDFSSIRPNGAEIRGQKGSCPGPVSLMKLINGNGEPVRAGGSRRVALMFSLDLDHPDIEEFLDAKLEQGNLQLANISVRSKKTTDFIKAVKEDLNWELNWKGKYKKTINARELWKKIVKNAYDSAEPGFLNWELVANENNIYYETELTTTNPCVPGDTDILTDSGYQSISSLVGQTTNVWNGFEWSEVIPRITGINQKILKIKLSNGQEFRCTPSHKFVLSTNYHGGEKRVEACELKIGNKLIKHNYPVLKQGIEVDHAYTQGFYSADGTKNRKIISLYEPKYPCLERLNYKSKATEQTLITGVKKTVLYLKTQPLPKEFVPFDWNLKNRLEWLSGLLDGDGCELKEGGCQIVSVDKDFLFNLQKLLTTCGVSGKINLVNKAGLRALPDGHGGYKEYYCQDSYRLCIGAVQMQDLKALGLNCSRLSFSKTPQRDASQFIKVVGVEEDGMEETVYCFTEHKRNLGCFNGVVTGNCGEIALSPHDCCCLGHLVLPRFVKNGKVDNHKLADTIRTSVRFLDNILTVNHYPLPEMKATSHRLRRIGLGTTGLADMLTMLGYTYGSKESLKFIDDLYRFISKAAYEASVLLAVEKGAFPACKPSEHVKSGFMKRMTKKIRSMVEEHGIRNCAILTQAPTGTVSILSGNCSSGIEPIFAPAYERRYWDGDERKVELVFHPLFKQFMDEGKDVSHIKSSRELNARDHMEVQKVVQKHVDNAVSKTINIPESYSIEEMSDLWLEYLPYLKGTTFYRENTRGYVDDDGKVHEPPLVALDINEAIKRYEEQTEDSEGKEVMDCPKGICEI